MKLHGWTRLSLIREDLPSKNTHCPRSGPGTACLIEE